MKEEKKTIVDKVFKDYIEPLAIAQDLKNIYQCECGKPNEDLRHSIIKCRPYSYFPYPKV